MGGKEEKPLQNEKNIDWVSKTKGTAQKKIRSKQTKN